MGYADEISRLAEATAEREAEYWQDRLGEYVLALYLMGALPAQPGDMLEKFLHVAPSRLRQHVMWYLGQQLELPLDKFPEDFRSRALSYWGARLAAAENASSKDEFRCPPSLAKNRRISPTVSRFFYVRYRQNCLKTLRIKVGPPKSLVCALASEATSP